ncbi:MAG: protein kinase [Pirellulaceae bacterium]|nr:protein kinase [Pirellulaceae bacterium]
MSVTTAKCDEPIPGYRVLQRIGAGGYGEVWTAQAPGDLVKAIKFVYGLMDEDRASRELKALNRIKGVRHPFLLSLERIEVVDGQLVIVTELADSSIKDRFEICRKEGKPGIPRDELLAYLRDTADALDYMSDQHSLQHLDVKPENLLLLGGRVKVADFGLVKDIHDHTASMMGGLTPVYAPPEVFEGKPSRRSDQYSLAIVYQEMLTGVVPFPGRTAAQLAAQHLNAKPRLSSLPPEDQPIVLRALSKKPNDRFSSCRELVDALCGAIRKPASSLGSGAFSPKPAAGPSATLGATQAAEGLLGGTLPAQVTGPMGSATTGPQVTTTQPRTAAEMLQHLESVSLSIDSAATGVFASAPRVTQHTAGPIIADLSGAAAPGDAFIPPMLADLGEAPPVVDLPPPDVDLAAWRIQPTLFVGIGGTGTRVLARLQRRLQDRLPAGARELFPMLALDSDARDLTTVTHTAGLQLRPEETLALPLRKSQEYRDDSRRLLEWLSRRWLYNIPRSQLTEGMRPLGRLALVDHADQAFGRIKGLLQRLLAARRDEAVVPRVVILAAIGGGTGGGMVTDVAFAARQILDELNQPDAQVQTVLTYATNRNPQQQELAGVNALATLTELQHFHRSPFPGDLSCKLKERSATRPAISDAYLVHLGEELATEQFDTACDKVAEFLLLDSVTPTAALLAATRQLPSEQPAEGAAEGLRLRTFGLCQIGFAHDQLIEAAVKRICRGVVERWQGAPRRVNPKTSVRLVARAVVDDDPEQHIRQLTDARAQAIVQELHLEVDSLMQIVQAMAADEMGGGPEVFCRQFLAGGALKTDRATIDIWMSHANDIFGRRPDEVVTNPPPAKLLLVLEERVTRLVGQVGLAIRKTIDTLIEEPALRVYGAQRIAKGLQAHLRHVCDRLREARGKLEGEAFALESALYASVPNAKIKSKGPKFSPAEFQTVFLQVCKLRLFALSAVVASNIANSLQSHAVMAYDGLVDLSRELHHLAVQFATDEIAEEGEEDSVSSPCDDLGPLRVMVSEQLRQADDTLAQHIDEHFTANVLYPAGGLKVSITAGGAEREALVAQLHTAARHAALGKLAAIDIAGSALCGEGENQPIRRCLGSAIPRLQASGGSRRLYCVVPAEAAQSLTPEMLRSQIPAEQFSQAAAVVPDDSGDVVLLFEQGGLSVKHAAAALIDSRADMAEMASRVHTRGDVTWTPLLGQ